MLADQFGRAAAIALIARSRIERVVAKLSRAKPEATVAPNGIPGLSATLAFESRCSAGSVGRLSARKSTHDIYVASGVLTFTPGLNSGSVRARWSRFAC